MDETKTTGLHSKKMMCYIDKNCVILMHLTCLVMLF